MYLVHMHISRMDLLNVSIVTSLRWDLVF
jgi:hypothetical protein